MIVKERNLTWCINCDWLSFSGQMILGEHETVNEPEICCPDGYRLELLDGTNVYRYRACLYDHRGRKVLTALWCPKSRAFNARLITFEVANYWLYSNNLYKVVDLSYTIHNYTFLCPTRYDIAVDFDLNKRQRQILNWLWLNKAYVSRKDEGSFWWHKEVDEPFPHQFNYGSKKSNFKWKLYNKSKELKIGSKKPDKPYIWHEWDAAGFVITNVWRLEISVNKFSGLTVNGYKIELESLVSSAFIMQFFGELYKARFNVRKKQGHTRKSNDEEIDLLRWPIKGLTVRTRQSQGGKVEARATTQMMKLCDVLESPMAAMDYGLFRQVSGALVTMVARYHLQDYFQVVKGMSVNHYIKQLQSSAGSGIVNLGIREKISFARIGDNVNSCWLRKQWIEKNKS